jgi:hypothetical protein
MGSRPLTLPPLDAPISRWGPYAIVPDVEDDSDQLLDPEEVRGSAGGGSPGREHVSLAEPRQPRAAPCRAPRGRSRPPPPPPPPPPALRLCTPSPRARPRPQAAAARRKEGWGGLAKHEYRRMLGLSLMLPLLQQASGINTVIYYSSLVGWPPGGEGLV